MEEQSEAQRISQSLRKNAKFSGTALEAREYLDAHPRLFSSKLRGEPTSSLYIERDGTVHILKPHTHEEIARAVLREATDLNPPDESPGHDEWIMTLLQRSGIAHSQVLSRGAGITFDLVKIPTSEQIKAIRDLHFTSGGNDFSAMLLRNGRNVAHIENIDQLPRAIYDNTH